MVQSLNMISNICVFIYAYACWCYWWLLLDKSIMIMSKLSDIGKIIKWMRIQVIDCIDRYYLWTELWVTDIMYSQEKLLQEWENFYNLEQHSDVCVIETLISKTIIIGKIKMMWMVWLKSYELLLMVS